MKLDPTLVYRLEAEYSKTRFTEIIRAITQQINDLSEGKMRAHHNAQATVPTGAAASYATGDITRDSHCIVQASIAPGVAAHYVRLGWITTAPGSPGTQVEMRFFTGT